MIGQKLYMAVWVHDEDTDYGECFHDDNTCTCFDPEPEPAGWREYALEAWPVKPEHEVWPNGYKPFFWPKTDVPYKSRSSAQARVDIINRWGGKAVLVECTPQWETVEAANRRRAAERVLARIDRKGAELAALQAEYAELTGCQPERASVKLADAGGALQEAFGALSRGAVKSGV